MCDLPAVEVVFLSHEMHDFFQSLVLVSVETGDGWFLRLPFSSRGPALRRGRDGRHSVRRLCYRWRLCMRHSEQTIGTVED